MRVLGRSLVLLPLAATLAACSDASPGFAPGPYTLARTEAGDPVSDTELAAVTDLYLDLLVELDYFRSISRRAHGWPENDPEGRPWYGSWWSGIRIRRDGTSLTFDHPPDGSDNNGMRSGPMLEGACYAHALWGGDGNAHLVQQMSRAFNAWMRAMERTSVPDAPVMLSRAFYPESITYEEGGLQITLDYDDQHPGEDNGATQYVHVPDNPHWGDIWVKNKRSKDDLGHMFRAIGALETCGAQLPADARADHDELRALYRAFSRQVEDDGFRIPTWNKDLEKWLPDESLAIFVTEFGTECNATLTFRLYGRGDAGTIDCKNGVTDADLTIAVLNDVRHIFLSFHEAAVQHALVAGLPAIAQRLAGGLALRSDQTHDTLERGESVGMFDDRDFAGDLAHAANAGVPLTWREVRTVHAAIRAAHETYLDGRNDRARVAFDVDAPAGEYPYDFGGEGFNFRDLGVVLGTCVSKWRSPDSKPVLDCERVKRAALAW
ncbi:hypothetical protein L6R52_44195 [Myxococcota bacterium]|nr:hypothetical protein [Myxococcota bacterium]